MKMTAALKKKAERKIQELEKEKEALRQSLEREKEFNQTARAQYDSELLANGLSENLKKIESEIFEVDKKIQLLKDVISGELYLSEKEERNAAKAIKLFSESLKSLKEVISHLNVYLDRLKSARELLK